MPEDGFISTIGYTIAHAKAVIKQETARIERLSKL